MGFVGPLLATLGLEIGGSLISKAINPTPQLGRLGQNDFHAIESTYGAEIPQCWGTYRLPANITWLSDITEHKYNVGGGLLSDGIDIFYYTQSVEYSYALGPAKAFLKIWLGDKVIYDQSAAPADAQSNVWGSNLGQALSAWFSPDTKAKDRLFESYELFLGTEDQEPSRIVQEVEGFGTTPADRGIVKLVIKNLNRTLLGNALPASSAVIQFSDYVPTPGPEEKLLATPRSVSTHGFGSHTSYENVSTTSGTIIRTASGSLADDVDPYILWENFALATPLPSDATITGIYPTVTLSRTGSALCGNTNYWSPVPPAGGGHIFGSQSEDGEIPLTTLVGDSLGTSLSALTGLRAMMDNASTANVSSCDDTFAVTSLGVEVRYTRPLVPPTGTTLDVIVSDLCKKALDPDEFDVTELAVFPVRGFKTETSAIRDVLRQLMEVFPFDARETDLKLEFIRRARPSVFTIPESYMVLSGDGNTGYRLSEPITQQNEVPAKFEVHYPDIDRDCQDSTQQSRRIVQPEATMEGFGVKSIHTNVVMNSDEAACVANWRLWEMWVRRYGASGQLLPKCLLIDPGDVVTIDYKGESRENKITEMTVGADLGVQI